MERIYNKTSALLNTSKAKIAKQNNTDAFLKKLNVKVKAFTVFLLFMFIVAGTQAAIRTASVNGNWNSSTTWGGAAVPTSADDVIINAGITVTVTANAVAKTVTVNGSLNVTGGNLTLTNSGTFTASSGSSIVFSANNVITGGGGAGNGIIISINSGASLTTANSLGFGGFVAKNTPLTGSFTINPGTVAIPNFNTGANFTYNGTVAQITGTGLSGANILTINNAVGVTLSAALTVNTINIGDVTANTVFNDGGYQITSNGSLLLNQGTFKLGATSATTFPAFTLRTIKPGTTIEYASTAAQEVSSTPTYANLTFSGASTKTAQGALIVNENLTISTGIFSAGTYTHSVGKNWTNNGTFTANSGTITFTSTSPGKTISGNLSGTSKFNKMIFEGVGGVWTLNDNTEIGGTSTALDIKYGVLTVSAGKWLDVKNGSTTLGSAECLILKSDGTNGTASFIDNGTTYVGLGTARIERYITEYNAPNDRMFHFLSSPVGADQAIMPEFQTMTNNDIDFYMWDEPSATWINTKQGTGPTYTWNASFGADPGAFEEGKGYLVAYPADGLKKFIGQPYTGTKVVNCTYTNNSFSGWNLLGNPYPSAIDWDNVSKGSGIDLALYYYDNSASKYRYYIGLTGGIGSNWLTGGSQYIPAMQGFMVHAKSSGTRTVTFTNNSRLHENMNLYYKNSVLTDNVLNLSVAGNNQTDEARVCFYESATANFDGDFDAFKLFSYNTSVPELYSVTTDQTQLAINTLPVSEMYGSVPVGFRPGSEGNYTFTADGVGSFPSNVYIKLEDKKTGTVQKLNDNPVYTFTSASSDISDRFVLHFQDATAINHPEATDNFTLYVDNGAITINQLESMSGKVKVSDMLGRTVAMENMVADTPLQINLNSTPGVYVVTVYTKSKTYSQKVVIR